MDVTILDNTGLVLGVGLALLAALIAAVWVVTQRTRRENMDQMARITDMAEALARQQEDMVRQQSMLSGAFQQSQATVNDRLDGLGKRLGDSLHQQSERTGQSLKTLYERLAVIDMAQKNLTDLSQQMVGLQDILSNKQARGAFGEIQLNDLVTATLPPSAYAFQVSLANGKRADCLLKLPNPPGPIVIDAKFPLESYQALRDAGSDEAAKVAAGRRFAQDVKTHVVAISEKYIVPGETAESALMFLPSEAVYAELHANFLNVVEESYRRRVWIVSPTTLMATLNTVRAVLKDSRMREQAHVIQAEVQKMMEDVGRLDDRVGKLQTHFDQATKDIRDIRISADKISKRGDKIEDLQLSDDSPAEDLAPAQSQPNLRLMGSED
ncbi:MAG: DNA recombination protein RmuC [Rhodospirillaceae bacterium]|nr:DNA recombination protein RmuC [Rhodospirillaceae bacterium]